MHRDILIVRNKTTNYNYWYIFHKPPCWAHADYSPLKQCCTLSKLVSFFFSADMWHSDLWFEAPDRTAGASKDVHFPLLLPSYAPAQCHAHSGSPSNQIFHYPSYFIIFPMTHLFLFTWCHCFFFLSRDGPEARAWQRNRSSADINILMEVEVLFEHLRWRSLHWLQHQVSNSDAFSSWWVKCF